MQKLRMRSVISKRYMKQLSKDIIKSELNKVIDFILDRFVIDVLAKYERTPSDIEKENFRTVFMKIVNKFK